MWLVFLRFADQGEVVTTHVRTSNKKGVEDIVKHAEQHGFTPTSRLVEYIGFYASGTIKLPQPNSKVQDHAEFLRRWEMASPTTHKSGNE
jgi:hypothetical protein